MEELIIKNKVAESGIISFDIAAYYPKEAAVLFDIKDFLFMGLILKEKEYRSALQALDWSPYEGKMVGITCSADAIIPLWAYMLAATYLSKVTPFVQNSPSEEAVKKEALLVALAKNDWAQYQDARVVIKGCGELPMPTEAYIAVTTYLLPYAKSIMYGEPCSTVPIYKKKNL